MTKQTDYDEALTNAWNEHIGFTPSWLTPDPIPDARFEDGFKEGYYFGVRQQVEKKKAEQTEHERNLIALGDDYMTASVEAQEKGFKDLENNPYKRDTKAEAYKQGWADADAFDSAWLDSYPEDAFQRILDSHPEIIENEVKARMKDLQNLDETTLRIRSDHFADVSKMMRYELAKAAMQGMLANGEKHVIRRAIQIADNMINELNK